MSIRIRSQVPDITVEAYVRGEDEPRRFSFSELSGQWVVLFFYPRDFTFICPTEIQSFAELDDEFQRERTLVLGASTDSYYSHKNWFETDSRLANVAYPIIADSNHALSRAYGVLGNPRTRFRAVEDPRAAKFVRVVGPIEADPS
jgi:peroxiredoxin (alkyl hydroperoxide reductase subunit C)